MVLDDTGIAIAKGIRDGKAAPFVKKSIQFRDGPNGNQGAIGILRNQDLELVYKYTAQGLSHGHYDKLSFSLYDNGEEVMQDYGLARFVNIEQKEGGNYLKENKTWAKETIAHITITQNEASHFNHKYEIASEYYSEKYLFNTENINVQVASAKEVNAYPGTQLHRTMVMIKEENLEKPSSDNSKFSWLNKGKFYTLTSVTPLDDELIFARIGANDPEFNLRRDASLIVRRKDTQNTLFTSIIEPHGNYSPVSEFSLNSKSYISNLKVVYNDANYTALEIENDKGNINVFIISNNDASKESEHNLNINNKEYRWVGPYYYKLIN